MADLDIASLVARHYHPGQTACAITLFLVDTQPEYRRLPQLGWRLHSTGALNVVPVPGTHASTVKGEDVTVLATRVGEHLARIDGLAGAELVRPRS
jgi:thioesterase domain-containing protein